MRNSRSRVLIFAGVQLSLDVSSAFDLMDWRPLDKALLASGVPPMLRPSVGSDRDASLHPYSGIIALAQIYRDLLNEEDPLITASWIEQSSTIYADDIHLKEIMHSARDLENMVYRFYKVLDALAAHGMVINSAKSALLLRHGELHQGLYSASHPPLYGIAASNPEARDILRMQHMMTKHVRAITKSFAHLQKESTRDLQRCSLRTILEHLHSEATALHRSLSHLNATTTFITVDHVEAVRATAASLHLQVQRQWQVQSATADSALDPATHQCQECHRVFTFFRLLRSHEAKWHGHKTPMAATVSFDRYAHSIGGLPTRRHCTHSFRQWDGLIKHIKRNRCQVLRRATALPSESGPGTGGGDSAAPAEMSKRQWLGPGLHRWFRKLFFNRWAQTQDLQYPGGQDQEWMEHRMNKLTQLVLRQEQIISAIRQDMVLYLFVRSGTEGMVPVLCEAAEKWRRMKEEEPEKISFSLKLAMFKQLLISLHQRLTNTALNWIDEQRHWRHLVWSPTQQRLEIDNSLRPIPTEDLLAQLVQMRKAVAEETLGDLGLDPVPALSFSSPGGRSHVEHIEPVDRASILAHAGPPAGTTHDMPVQVLHSVPWLTMLQAWPHVHRQHDAAELVMYLLQRLLHSGFNGGWEARNYDSTQGLPRKPLMASCALQCPVSLLCIQLQRFASHEGALHRDVRPMVMSSDRIRMPIFDAVDTMRVWYASYQVVAMLLHYGDTPDSGHHRTILRGQPVFGDENQWITDDSCTAKPVQHEHDGQIYILWMRQVYQTDA
ncbi:unnamed protein product [Symbiodinium sp. CCMP2592]|nr:unnamed protein product [Symbiodinium sp. CCMP2592]